MCEQEVNSYLWKRIFMTEPQGVIVIIDPQVGESRGQLRALPLLVELGLQKYTFATSLNQFQFVPYQHCVVHEGTTADELRPMFPIVQFVAQSTEDRSQSDATKKLLMAQRSQPDNPLLVYVLESEQFMLRASTGSKGFIDEYELKRVYSYKKLFFRFCETADLPVKDLGAQYSLNLMLHRLANELGNQDILLRLADVFDYTQLPPTSWAWNLLERLVEQKKVRQDDRGIFHLLGPWIDSDITKVTHRLLATVQRFDYNLARVQEERQRLLAQTEER